jgi:hypothetical protein
MAAPFLGLRLRASISVGVDVVTDDTTVSSAYSTGGGGWKLEHEYAGRALACLLVATPIEGLGDDLVVTRVALQQEALSPVDDVHVEGTGPGGSRSLRVACRRRPTLAKSDDSTVKLFADYALVVSDQWNALEADILRLGLAVSAPFGPAAELQLLTEVARRQGSRAEFQTAINAKGAYSAAVRKRLTHIDELVQSALAHVNRSGSIPSDECSWRLLRSLYVIALQLEGDAASSRTEVVRQLQSMAGSATRANDLRLRLNDIAADAATRAGGQNRASLRRELRAFGPLGPSADYTKAAAQVAALEQTLLRSTMRSLPTSVDTTDLVLDRAEPRRALVSIVKQAGTGGVVIVRGEADVGKSALALDTADEVRRAGGHVIALSLRDLPSAVSQFGPTVGLTPADLVAGAPSAPVSLLLLDGGEVVQEGSEAVLASLLHAAATMGRITVIVVRDDAADAVSELTKRQQRATITEYSVPILSDAELARVLHAAPELGRYSSDPRAVWLLRRLGFVELLLRAARRGRSLPTALSSESEIFSAVWHGLIRHAEQTIAGVSPDDREYATLEVAREHLTMVPARPVPGGALAALRSDNVLRSRNPDALWQGGDQFGSDVLRDFATAAVLLRHGLSLVAGATAPRWAVRAARLYAQNRLAQVVTTEDVRIVDRWSELASEFSVLAAEHGTRWAELPWEALFTAGWAERVLNALTSQLLSDPGARLDAIRCIERRFSFEGGLDPVVGAPLVSWFVKCRILHQPLNYDDEPVLGFIRGWLIGVARRERGGEDVSVHRAVRAALRDALLSSQTEPNDEILLECLALLGNDATSESTEMLRAEAGRAPEYLGHLVENVDVALTLSRFDPSLLADLADAYYVIAARPDDELADLIGSTVIEDGIRSHIGGGWNTPMAGWYRGPFYILLRTDFSRALKLLNRMLDRAARQTLWSRSSGVFGEPVAAAAPQLPGVPLNLLGVGTRFYIGDEQVWQWYRGSAVGPYPCVSALLALERVLDEFVRVDMRPAAIAAMVLRDATTLATVGLIMGFLIRHFEHVTTELYSFIGNRIVWEFEFRRVVAEGFFHVQGPDTAELIGANRRSWSPIDVTMRLVITAARGGDEKTLGKLRAVGQDLLNSAGGSDAPPEVHRWAANFDWDRYSSKNIGEYVAYEVKPSEDVQAALAPALAKSALIQEMFRLHNRYRLRSPLPYQSASPELPDESTLARDVAVARDLEGKLMDEDPLLLNGALAGVASAVLQAAVSRLPIPAEDFRWSILELTRNVADPGDDDLLEHSIFPAGADRRAAFAIPMALRLTRRVASEKSLESGDAIALSEVEARQVEVALTTAMRSRAVEVRAHAMQGMRVAFDGSCTTAEPGKCVHEIALNALEAGARRTVLGKWKHDQGRRPLDEIQGDLVAGLDLRPDEDLLLSHVAVSAIGSIDAARAQTCITARAIELRGALTRAYSRAARIWAERHYSWRDEQHAAFASAVFRWSAEDGATVMTTLADSLHPSEAAVASFMRAMVVVATYEADVVPDLTNAWPSLMSSALALLDTPKSGWNDRDRDALLQQLVPHPSPLVSSEDLTGVIRDAERRWLPMDAVKVHIQEWLRYAQGSQWCVDSLVGFLRAQPIRAQTTDGLRWIRELVVAENGTARSGSFLLVDWLKEVRDVALLDQTSLSNYRAVIDTLVLRGSAAARELQQRDE